MTAEDISSLLDGYAPFSLSGEYCKQYGAYDNSGLLISLPAPFTGALCSLDFSLGAAERAIEEKKSLLITHHPAIYSPYSRLDAREPSGRKLALCAKHGISVLSAHLNLDCAAGGIDEHLKEGICLAAGGGGDNKVIFEPLSLPDTGYGRGYETNPVSFSALVANMKKVFRTERVISYGKEKTVCRCASFCGAGADEKAVSHAVRYGADVIVSSDFKHHIVAMAAEAGLNVIALTHYASEAYGFSAIMNKILPQAGVPYAVFTDTALL